MWPTVDLSWKALLYSLNFHPNFSSQTPKFGNFQLTSPKIWKFSAHKPPNLEIFSSQAPKFGNFQLTSPQIWKFTAHKPPNLEIFSSQAPKFGNFQFTSPQIWKFSFHKPPFTEANISSQTPYFGNPGCTPLPEKMLSASPRCSIILHAFFCD